LPDSRARYGLMHATDMTQTENSQPQINLPDFPACVIGVKQAYLLTTDGEVKSLDFYAAGRLIYNKAAIICHTPYTASKLRADFTAFDLLELFLFVYPTRFTVPTVPGVAKALGLASDYEAEDLPLLLVDCLSTLLKDLTELPEDKRTALSKTAKLMGLQGRGWVWAPYVMGALGFPYDPKEQVNAQPVLSLLKKLPEWSERAPPPPPSQYPVSIEKAEERLKAFLREGNTASEERPQQVDFTKAMTHVFDTKDDLEEPHVLLAQAGTGVGKTLGYLAPASVWAQENEGAVWISTYTRNLQQQLESELERLYPDESLREQKVAVRKGRENYLCLLNYEDLVASAPMARSVKTAVAAGLMSRWITETKDGDITGKSFQGWIPNLLGTANTRGLTLKSGECIYSACDHYNRCFKEKAIRKSRHAEIVVANHALVMIQTAIAGSQETLPQRYIFDEGHHLFDAADSAYAAHLTGRQGRELRRWVLGSEESRRQRNRGLKRRAEELVAAEPEDEKLLLAILHHARALPAQGWLKRLIENSPQGPAEAFFLNLHHQIQARNPGTDTFYSLETQTYPVNTALLPLIAPFKAALLSLQKPMIKLAKRLAQKIADDEGEGLMDADIRRRMDSLSRSLERRGQLEIGAWIGMLETLEKGEKPQDFIDWLEIEKIDGKAFDTGMYRHYVDPMKPFAASLLPHAHGVGITSATLKDRTGNEDHDWKTAHLHTGSAYLSTQGRQFEANSPFDYNKQAKVFILSDVNKANTAQVAGAMNALFTASNGGGLGLFTSIQRLRSTHNILQDKLGLPLYAQHYEQVDTGTLIDLFREDENSCLLGTDAMRDGVDVPGKSLRLITFDRVPWPRPTILHKNRRKHFGGREYDERITRLKLQQAFGRLIRSAQDKGVFVMLDNATPSRLLTAFPEQIEVNKLGLNEACAEIKLFFSNS